MLGIEAIPAILYFFGLFTVPKSPRWLIVQGKEKLATQVMSKFYSAEEARREIQEITNSIRKTTSTTNASYFEIFKPAMRLVLTIGLVVSVLQQITGINAVFFYAPMIFEQSGIGTNASFVQAVLVGITNLIFTIIAIAVIDRLGRKPLLTLGVGGIVIFMGLLAYGFHSSSYKLEKESLSQFPDGIASSLTKIVGVSYENDIAYKKALNETLGLEKAKIYEAELIKVAIGLNPNLILIGILGFVACFAVSLGPVMWVLFSELFPSRIRGIAISFVGFINSVVSALVQFIFPWELSHLGSATTFLIYGIFALIGLILVVKIIPETKGRSLEKLEKELVG
jgi:MFS family permease